MKTLLCMLNGELYIAGFHVAKTRDIVEFNVPWNTTVLSEILQGPQIIYYFCAAWNFFFSIEKFWGIKWVFYYKVMCCHPAEILGIIPVTSRSICYAWE